MNPSRPLNLDECMDLFRKRLRICCKRERCLGHNSSDVSFDTVRETVAKCREIISTKTAEEREAFLLESMRRSIIDFDLFNEALDSSADFQYDFMLPGRLPVCRRAWSACFGYSKHKMDAAAARLRVNKKATSLQHRVYTDRTIHPYFHSQVEEILYSNIPEYGLFTIHFRLLLLLISLIAEGSWIPYAITPHVSVQHTCVLWLHDYFVNYGDQSPNSEEIHISVSKKADLFEVYKADQGTFNLPHVQISKFRELWNALYPHHLTRPWINVPGKCDLCAKIDELRQQNSDKQVAEALRQCHLLHRAGFIMAERSK
jgi:hypothetical protein